jgi:hypothetical protein
MIHLRMAIPKYDEIMLPLLKVFKRIDSDQFDET